jgi:GH24 family phage-related lysozyme (muramidase)
MASVPELQAPQVQQQGGSADRYQRADYQSAVVPNPGIGGGLRELGGGIQQAGDFFGQVAADDAYNEFESATQKLLNGDPEKMVPGPDGQMTQDTGYLGLKGRAALDARPATVKAIDGIRDRVRGNLKSIKQDAQFDRVARRYNAIIDGQVGTHARTQANVYASNVNSALDKNGQAKIAGNSDDDALVQEGLDDMKKARVQEAQLKGGGTELVLEAKRSAERDGMSTLIQSIATKDPARALRMTERNKGILGTNYDNLYGSLRARADQQMGVESADRRVGATSPLLDGGSSQAVLRQFEGFKNTAYWDVNHWRVGYGSDTVTRADGTVEKVTENTVVSKEDAERDLERRTAISQNQVRNAIGAGAWDKLDNRGKASLTSIAYNYGKVPDQLIEAAKSGDKEKLANAVLGLSSHNGGVNARRRATEAANIQGKNGPGERPSMQNQAEILTDIDNDPSLSPQAKAAATAQVNKLYTISRNHQIKTQAQFDERLKNSESEAVKSGSTVDPIPETDFVSQYGDVQGPVKYREYVSNVQYGADYKSMQGMSDVEMDRTIDYREASIQPGSPSYAKDQANITRLRKGADALKQERLNDPAGAVSRMAPVMDATKGYDKNKPETFAPLAAARMAAQEQLGIPAENQTPITKREAEAFMKPLMLALPGQKMDALEKIGVQFRGMFGDNADRAFLYGLRVMKVTGEVAAGAEGVLRSLSEGKPLTESERRDAREKAQAAEIEAALSKTAPPARMDTWMYADPGGGGFTGFGAPVDTPPSGGDTGKRPTPNGGAIKDLRDNPSTAAQFDEVYGPGTAKKLMETYPAYFGRKK